MIENGETIIILKMPILNLEILKLEVSSECLLILTDFHDLPTGAVACEKERYVGISCGGGVYRCHFHCGLIYRVLFAYIDGSSAA